MKYLISLLLIVTFTSCYTNITYEDAVDDLNREQITTIEVLNNIDTTLLVSIVDDEIFIVSKTDHLVTVKQEFAKKGMNEGVIVLFLILIILIVLSIMGLIVLVSY